MARVLVVDDEESIRETLHAFLKRDGHEVHVAEDAEQALALLEDGGFDVVVTDIILSRVTGVDLLRKVRDVASHVQVVMMTGEPTVETASDSLRAGAFDYLVKPIEKNAIIRVVANAATTRRGGSRRRTGTTKRISSPWYRSGPTSCVRARSGSDCCSRTCLSAISRWTRMGASSR